MSAIIPLGVGGMSKEALALISEKRQSMAIQEDNDIEIHQGRPLNRQTNRPEIQIRPRQVVLSGRRIEVDPYQLIRLIKRVTQNIGEYKDLDDIYSAIICGALRKARGDLVNILESEFHIHWEVDRESGKSIFYM